MNIELMSRQSIKLYKNLRNEFYDNIQQSGITDTCIEFNHFIDLTYPILLKELLAKLGPTIDYFDKLPVHPVSVSEGLDLDNYQTFEERDAEKR